MSDDTKPHVYIRSFNDSEVGEAITALEKIERKYQEDQPILLHVDSHGGSVKGLSLLYSKVVTMKNPIMTYTSSVAMSAGAIVLSSFAPKGMRFASPEASIMIHELQSSAFGDIKDIEDRFTWSKMVNKKWMDILAKSMGLKNHVDIRKLIKEKAVGQDVFLTAKQAKQLGIIDEICYINLMPRQSWDIERMSV